MEPFFIDGRKTFFGNEEMVDNPPTTEPILQKVPTLGVSEREVSTLSGGDGSNVKTPVAALVEIMTWMVGQLGD